MAMKRGRGRRPKQKLLNEDLDKEESTIDFISQQVQEPVVDVDISQKLFLDGNITLKTTEPIICINISGDKEDGNQEQYEPESFQMNFNDHFMANVSINDMKVKKLITSVNSKRFECTECGKCFNYASSLSYHKRTHSGTKPFQCDVCSKRFTDSSNLKAHKRIHRGDKNDTSQKFYTNSNHATIPKNDGKKSKQLTNNLSKHLTNNLNKQPTNNLSKQLTNNMSKQLTCNPSAKSNLSPAKKVVEIHNGSLYKNNEKLYTCIVGEPFSSINSINHHLNNKKDGNKIKPAKSEVIITRIKNSEKFKACQRYLQGKEDCFKLSGKNLRKKANKT